jgi:hypothetical protein
VASVDRLVSETGHRVPMCSLAMGPARHAHRTSARLGLGRSRPDSRAGASELPGSWCDARRAPRHTKMPCLIAGWSGLSISANTARGHEVWTGVSKSSALFGLSTVTVMLVVVGWSPSAGLRCSGTGGRGLERWSVLLRVAPVLG